MAQQITVKLVGWKIQPSRHQANIRRFSSSVAATAGVSEQNCELANNGPKSLYRASFYNENKPRRINADFANNFS